jgi:hypothetical protein
MKTRSTRSLARQTRRLSRIITLSLFGLGVLCSVAVMLAGSPVAGLFLLSVNVSTLAATL